jgi:hypothetical protein
LDLTPLITWRLGVLNLIPLASWRLGVLKHLAASENTHNFGGLRA